MALRMTVTSNGAAKRTNDAIAQRARNLLPAARRFGEWIAREARRRAPVGFGGGNLKKSLNHVEPAHNITQLVSPLKYARIQQFGGSVSAPGQSSTISPKPKMLAIPLTVEARRMAEGLGASETLRGKFGLQMIITPRAVFLVRAAGSDKDRTKYASWKGKSVLMRRVGDLGDGKGGRIEFLFILKKSVTLKPNPGPDGYAPRMSEPAVRDAAAKAIRWCLKGGL